MPSRPTPRAGLLAATAVLALAACGQRDGRGADTTTSAGTGGLNAPAVGAGGDVNGRGITDSNAARSANGGGTGAPNNNGLGTTGTGETGTTTGAAGAGAAAVGPAPRPGVPGTDTTTRRP
jgi:hypothetical protein